MFCNEVIEQAATESTVHILFTSNNDGFLGVCVYCRKPSSLTVKDTYPFQRMGEYIDFLGKVTIYLI